MDEGTSAGDFKFLAIVLNIKEAVELEFMCKQPDKRPHVLSELSTLLPMVCLLISLTMPILAYEIKIKIFEQFLQRD